MTCRLEKTIAALLDTAGIEYTRPEYDRADPTNLDFFIPSLRVYIEVKQFHSMRIANQLAAVPERVTAIVLQGPDAANDFIKLCRLLVAP